MSIRGGRGPRDDQDDAGNYRNGYHRTGRYGRGPGDQRKYERYGSRNGGMGGILRFIVFLGLLAGGVLLVMVTVARPLVRAVIVPWADDNPAALRIPFVEDMVREDIGPALTAAADGSADEIAFTVQSGDTPATVAPRLLEQGIIANERAFLFQARVDDLGTKLTAGQFGLTGNLTPAQVVEGLVANRITVRNVPVTFREGLRIEQMTAKLANDANTEIDPQEFYKLATNPPDELIADFPWLLEDGVHPKGTSLEGFLYPATYDFTKLTTTKQLVADQLDAFRENWSQVDLKYAKSKNLTPYDVLIIASMIEKEVQVPKERSLVAAVIYNRLHLDMPLGIDATIRYGLNIPPTKAILQSQLDTPSPYNTRCCPGLPPTPIGNPGIASMQAAAHPAKVDYLYFVRKADCKSHFFTASLRAFNNYPRAGLDCG